jgi:hypothetical protein
VQHGDKRQRQLDRLVVDEHAVLRRDADGELAQAVAVDRDGAVADQVLARPPRAETGAGKILV